MYFVNWQRDIKISNRNGQKVVLKSNKKSKNFHEYLLALSYTLVSIALGHPDSPPIVGQMAIKNEGSSMRSYLMKLGIRTPKLISLSDCILVEEYIGGGDLYKVFLSVDNNNIVSSLATRAGIITGNLHSDGRVFIDNKSQNYLVGNDDGSLYRTDLGFIQRKTSVFSQSMDIATFLASSLDLSTLRYSVIENSFRQGYYSIMRSGFPYLSIILRNLLAPGFAFNHKWMLKNMLINSVGKCPLTS